ncbi:hypothetical protein [Aestuariivivens insulae]|uniref:hypothetical protein n=1 Tax=Aestuariivivens insulae TaxID=1621988 RepID=UPI001F58EA5C|nr:hypothetical protein [Aestuariivivens insulae]
MLKNRLIFSAGALVLAFFLIFKYFYKEESFDDNGTILLSDYLFKKGNYGVANYEKIDGLSNNIRLDTLIRNKLEQLVETKNVDSSFVSELNKFTKDNSVDKTRKSFIKLFLARKYFDSSRVVSARLCREILPVFQKNNDTLAQILTLNQMLNVNYYENWPRLVGDRYLVEKYFVEIEGLTLNSTNALYKLYGCYNDLRKGASKIVPISSERVNQAFNEGILIIDNNKEFEFYRQFFYRTYSSYCWGLGNYKEALDYSIEILEFPVLVDTFLIYNDISNGYYFLKDYQKALGYANLAIEAYEKQKERDFESKVWLYNLKKNVLYELEGDNASDLVKFINKTLNMLYVIRNKNWNLRAYELQVEYQTEKKEQEVANYKEDQKQMTIYLVTAFFFIVLIFILLLRIYRVNKRLNEEMHVKMEIQRVISHDLLSPLHSMEIIIEELKNYSINDKEIKSKLLLQNAYLNNIKGLCNNLINWLWIDRRGKGEHKEFIKKSIEQCLEDLTPFFEANKCEVLTYYHFNEEEESFKSNCTNVLIRNILTNIVRHSKARKIILEVLIEQQMVYFKFYDNGNKMDRLLQKDIQDYINSSKKEFGSSLGMFLIKTYANKLKAQLLFATSDREGYCNFQILKFPYQSLS